MTSELGSIRHYNLSLRRIVFLGVLAGVGITTSVAQGGAGALGGASVPVGLALGSLGFYLVVTTPGRALRASAMSQAAESPAFALSLSTAFLATRSRPRSFLLASSGNDELGSALRNIKRRILLGHGVAETANAEARRLASYSASNILSSLASNEISRVVERGEERGGLVGAEDLSSETRMPMMLAVCMFAPILLVLLVAFFRPSSDWALAGVVVVDAVVLELSLRLCSSEVKPWVGR